MYHTPKNIKNIFQLESNMLATFIYYRWFLFYSYEKLYDLLIELLTHLLFAKINLVFQEADVFSERVAII